MVQLDLNELRLEFFKSLCISVGLTRDLKNSTTDSTSLLLANSEHSCEFHGIAWRGELTDLTWDFTNLVQDPIYLTQNLIQ